MQLTLRRKRRLVDTFSVAINVYAALFSIAAIGTAIVSPWIAHVTGDWSGVFPAVAIGVLGLYLARLEWAILGAMVHDALVRLAAERPRTHAKALVASAAGVFVFRPRYCELELVHEEGTDGQEQSRQEGRRRRTTGEAAAATGGVRRLSSSGGAPHPR